MQTTQPPGRIQNHPHLFDYGDQAGERPPLAVEIARRRMLQRGSSSDRPVLSNGRVIRNSPIQASPSTAETTSVAGKVFKYIWHTRVGVFTGKIILKCTRTCLTYSADSASKQLEAEIIKLSGSEHLIKAMHAFAPVLAKSLQQILVNFEWWETFKLSFKSFFQSEHHTITTLMKVLLMRMYINIARNIEEGFSEDDRARKRPVTIIDVIACIQEIVSSHLPRILAHIDGIEKNVDLNKRAKMISQLFAPLIDDFLVTALPEEERELPFTHLPWVSKQLWTKIQKQLFPTILQVIFQEFNAPFKKEKKQALLTVKGGVTLASLAELLGKKAGELLPSLFAKEKDAKGNPALVDAILNSLPSTMDPALREWLGQQLIDFGNNTSPEIKNLWMYLGSYLQPLLIHIFVHLTALPDEKGSLPDAFGLIAIRIFMVCSRFFNPSFDLPKKEDKRLAEFVPLADKFFKMMGLKRSEKWPLPSFFQEIAYAQIHAMLPGFLLKAYEAISAHTFPVTDVRKRLREIIFDEKKLTEPAVTTKLIAALHEKVAKHGPNLPEEFYQDLWEVSGTEKAAKAFEGICAVLADDTVSAVMSQLGVSAQQELIPSMNPFMGKVTKFVKSWIESIWLEFLVDLFETTKLSAPHKILGNANKNWLPLNILQRLFGIVDVGLTGMSDKLKEIDSGQDKGRVSQEIRKAFIPFAKGISALITKNPLDKLPLEKLPGADNLKGELWSVLRETLLPDVISSIYLETVLWQNQIGASHNELEDCYHTTHARWSVHALAKYVTDFTKHYLTNNCEELAESLLGSMQDCFGKATDKGAQDLVKFITERKAVVVQMFGKNLRFIGEDRDDKVKDLWPALNLYVEALLAKLFAKLSHAIHTAEAENPEILIDAAIAMLKETAEYFKLINQSSKKHIHRVATHVTLASFGSKLHPGVPLNPKANEAEKSQVRLQGEFIPLATKIFQLAGMAIKDLPAPGPMKGVLGDFLVGKILPQVLMGATFKMTEPQMRDSVMLSFVQTLYAALNAIEQKPKESMPEEAKKISPKQKHLNETCGTLVLEVVKLIPDTMVQYVFMKEKVKNMSAETIGESLMPHLSKWTFIQMIDAILYSGMPNFHPSRWEGKVGREKLVPRKAVLCPDGKMELKSAKHFKFTFHKNLSEVHSENESRKIEAKVIRKQLRDEFTRTISSQLLVKAWEFVKGLWDNLQAQINDFVERVFPGQGPKYKEMLDKIFHRIFFDVIGTMVKFVLGPLITGLQIVMEKVYINKKADEIIENMHSETFEHLLYKWVDVMIESLRPKTAIIPTFPSLV